MLGVHVAVVLALGVPAPAAGFDRCATTLQDDSHGRSTAVCVRTIAEASGRWEAAAAWLEAAFARHPRSGWLALQIAEMKARLRTADALDWYAAAVDTLISASDPGGEAEARVGMGVGLYRAGRAEDAWSEAPRILVAAKKSGETALIARAHVYEAWLAQQTGERLGHALRSLHEAEPLVFPNGPYAQQLRVLFGLGNVSFELGRYDVALSYYARVVDLAREHDDAPMVALGASNVLTTRRKQMELRPDASRLPEFTDEARRIVKVADQVNDVDLQTIAHRALADLLASAPATRDEAGRHYRLALTCARRSKNRSEMATSLWGLGRYLSDVRQAESRTLVDEALRMAVDSGSATSMAYAWRQQMRLAWKSLPRDRALVESLRALDAIETLRTLQDADLERASVLGAWTSDYYWLIGQLLRPASRSPENVAVAFSVSERMRSRVLLDSLKRQRRSGGRAPEDGRRLEALKAISAVQRRLLDPVVRGEARASALADLERLERQEAGLRDETAPPGTLVSARELAALETVEQSMAADQALLSFSIGVGRTFYGEFGGGAWLLVVTRAGTRVIELPDRTRLEPVLSVFRGLVERSGQIEDAPAVALYKTLLGDALESLPRTITRLVVIADGAVHHVPFAVLKPTGEAPPLGSSHEVVVAPSATVWRQLTERAALPRGGHALVLADPVVPDAEHRMMVAREREWSLQALALGRLSHSRVEGRAIVSRVGGSRLLAGADATETAVRSIPAGFTILHFATHAFVDDVHPERSAVLLSSAGSDDGLLQAREIADLPLDGRVVVLSACRTATGAVLAGEGVVGLSRSFFQAGARTVVGTLWAIRDDHAARFAEAFYASLAGGQSVGFALRQARRRSIADGLPASAWASYVVIGDGSVVPLPRAAGSWPNPVSLLALAAALVLSLGLLSWNRRRSSSVAP